MSSMDVEPPVQVAPRITAVPDWEIVVYDTGPLAMLVKTVSAVLERNVMFRIDKEDDFYFLMVDGNDPGFSCSLSARLQIDETHFKTDGEAQGARFCVDPKHLLIALDGSSNATSHVKVQAFSQEALVRVVLYDPERKSCEEVSELVTYVHGDEEQLREFDFLLTLELDLVKLKELIRKARDCKAEKLNIKVDTKQYGATERSRIQFLVSGEMTLKQRFAHAVHQDEDGSLYVRADDDGLDDLSHTGWETKLDQTFPVAKIDAFVKNLPNTMVSSNLRNGLPLMIAHKLGGAHEMSHLRFFVAPLVDGSED